MGALPRERDYHDVADPERALKYAIQHIEGDRVEIIEGVIEQMPPTWGHERAITRIRRQLDPRLIELDCEPGSGNLDLPGSANWYVPDLAVVPSRLVDDGGALLPDQTLLIVEVTSDSNGDTDRVVKRRRYAEYGAPLYLLVDRQERACTLYSVPGPLGYTRADGPYPFGTAVQLPEPFGLALETGDF
ncbi:Uma2 family endonuclease [Kitasatospora paracochleata]|uniref:Uma2 family endonuclease n=1 Tax=Kitasatospora paracochleata TaxID=58354 RepID=A0ABT1IPW7_9ACTN|nr:Uma2 family endonuclease [Kitasatospora paracochleata]MCP2307159.1 Uma2 family endonuclease [Kitasatospora paracochleata]